MAKKTVHTKFIGHVTKVRQTKPAIVIEWPRTLTHVHTYGMLSPFFEGLKEGKLRATFCPNPNCPEKASMDSASWTLSGLSYGNDLEDPPESRDRQNPHLHSGGLRRRRCRALHSLLAG